MAEFFAIASGIILLAGAPPYVIDILKHKTKPERTTWFIWSVLGSIAFVSQISLHGKWSLVFVGLDGFGSLLVFLLSLKYGVGGWTALDKLALVIATAGVGLSLVARQPIVALLGVVLADLSGAVLTMLKTFKQPESETSITWFMIGLASLFGALSVPKLSAELLIYPIYLVVANWGVLAAQGFGYAYNKAGKKLVE